MNQALVGISVIWTLVFIYAMAGSVDFGAGFWAMVYHRQQDARAATIANRYLSPLWEVTNVFLVLFAVALIGLFPTAAYTLGILLLVPGSMILVLLTIRTVFMVYAHVVKSYQFTLRIVSGITGLLIPALLVAVLPISQGSFTNTVGADHLLGIAALFTHWTTYTYARVADDESAYQVYRKHTLWLGPLALVSALVVLWGMPVTASWLRAGLGRQAAWFLASGILFVIAWVLFYLAKSRQQHIYRWGVVLVAMQYASAMVGYGRAHLPYIVYPIATVEGSFTNAEMFRAAVLVLVIGIAVLFPGFVWFWRLFLENRAYVGRP